MKYTIVFLIVALCVVSLPSISMADCGPCVGASGWHYYELGCADPGGSCYGIGDCDPCINYRTFGTCAGTSGSCYTTYGYTVEADIYEKSGPSGAWVALCWAAYLLHGDSFIYCGCKAGGATCSLVDVEFSGWAYGCE